MAFLNPLEEEKNKQEAQNYQPQIAAPNFTGGQLVESGSTSSGAPKGASGAPTSSGRWINISDYLNANPSIGKMAQEKGDKLLSAEKGIYDKAADPLRNASYSTPIAQSALNPGTVEKSLYYDAIGKGGQTAFGVDDLRKNLNTTYEGPRSVDYDETKSGNVAKEKKLSNLETATDVLAEDEIKKGGYGLGLRNLDTSLLGADSNYGQYAPQMWKNVSSFLDSSRKEMGNLADKASGFDKAADEARKTTRGLLEGQKAKTMADLQAKFEKAQKESADAKRNYIQQYGDWYNNVYSPVSNKGNFSFFNLFDKGPMSNYTDPTMGNVGSQQEYGVLSSLGNLLGGDVPKYSGQSYKAPTYGDADWKKESDAWFASPEGKKWNSGGGATPVLGGKALDEVNKEIARLNSGKVETPEELARRLGLI